MRDGGSNLTEEQAWILRKVIEAAVQLLTDEEDIKKCVSLFENWEAGTLYLSLKKSDIMVMFTNAFCLIHHLVLKRQKTKLIGSWWYKKK